jgi:hypothetical protein
MHRNASQPAESSSIGIIHRALDAGINFIDTADVYSQGESEVIVGKALAGGRRDGVILATKFHAPDGTTASGGWAPTGSISTRCTARIPTPTSRGPPSPTCSAKARSGRSAPRPSRRTRSSRRSGRRSSGRFPTHTCSLRPVQPGQPAQARRCRRLGRAGRTGRDVPDPPGAAAAPPDPSRPDRHSEPNGLLRRAQRSIRSRMAVFYLLRTTWKASARRPAGRAAAAVFGSIRSRISVASRSRWPV